jgi:hypothetical protein
MQQSSGKQISFRRRTRQHINDATIITYRHCCFYGDDYCFYYDMQAPLFLGEHCGLGILQYVVQAAITCRYLAWKLLKFLGLPKQAPHPSYISALRAGVDFETVNKNLQREVAYATFVLAFALFSIVNLLWTAYQQHRYLFM